VRKPLAHLLLSLMNKGVVGAAHRDESLEAPNKNILLPAMSSSSSGGLGGRGGCMPHSRRVMCTGRRGSNNR
jgi:hypothetical protein